MNNKDDDKLTGARGFLSINVERGGRYRKRSWVDCNHQQRDDNDDDDDYGDDLRQKGQLL